MQPGWTLYLCFGKSGGFSIRTGPQAYGVVLGCVSFCLVRCDVERTVEDLSQRTVTAERALRARELTQ